MKLYTMVWLVLVSNTVSKLAQMEQQQFFFSFDVCCVCAFLLPSTHHSVIRIHLSIRRGRLIHSILLVSLHECETIFAWLCFCQWPKPKIYAHGWLLQAKHTKTNPSLFRHIRCAYSSISYRMYIPKPVFCSEQLFLYVIFYPLFFALLLFATRQ